MARAVFSTALLKAFLTLCALFSAPSLWAVTFYVEKFGNNNNSCRSLAAPCATIQQAILKGSGRDTVIVGIGTYEEALVVERLGVRLISRGGAGATFIDASNQAGTPAVTVTADKVRIGQRRRGFTFRTSVDAAVVAHVLGHMVSLEDNTFASATTIFEYGVLFQGDSGVIRYNRFRTSLRLLPVNENHAAIKGELISDNEFIGAGLITLSTAEGNRNRIQNNHLPDGRVSVANVEPGGNFYPFLTRTKDRITGNTIGAFLYVYGGSNTIDGNRAESFWVFDTVNSVLRKNLIIGRDTPYGMLFSYSTELTILNNTITGVRQGYQFDAPNSVKVFRNNNLWDYSSCALLPFVDGEGARRLRMTGNYWGASGAPDLSCSVFGEQYVSEGLLSFAPKNQPNNY